MSGSEDETSSGHPRPPYGPPIHDAIASNDLQHMKAIAEAARKALYSVDFEPVTAERHDEVKEALDALDSAITRIEQAGGSHG